MLKTMMPQFKLNPGTRHVFKKGESLSFDDVLLIPQKSVLASRKDADISGRLVGDLRINVPIVASPMTSVINSEMASAIYRAGGFSFLHRFNTPQEQAEEFQRATVHHLDNRMMVCGAAFGLKDAQERVERLYETGCRIFTLDVAHAHSLEVLNQLEKLSIPDDVHLIVGSIATWDAAVDFIDFGVSGFRVGIGPGAACTTREVTGFGVGQLTAIMEIYEAIADMVAVGKINKAPTLISDGSIKSSGDIVKALAAGADTVMVGRILAGTNEAPYPGEYFGMASKRVNGHNAPEGEEGEIEHSGPVEEVIKKLAWGIRSGISYGGTDSAEKLRETAVFDIIRPGVTHESKVRI